MHGYTYTQMYTTSINERRGQNFEVECGIGLREGLGEEKGRKKCNYTLKN